MPLIIHADDFGKDEGVTHAIAEVMSKGWCHETSLMVNMPFADRAVSIARERGFANKVGLHLNLTQGEPLTKDIIRFPSFCDSDGTFNKRFHVSQMARFVLSGAERAAMAKEIEAQLRKFVSYGGLMMRIDSHHHVHTDWVVYLTLMPLARKFGFNSMRLSATLHKVSFPTWVYKWIFNCYIRASFKTTDEFDGDTENVIPKVRKGRVVELMVHPLYASSGEILDSTTPYQDLVCRLERGLVLVAQ